MVVLVFFRYQNIVPRSGTFLFMQEAAASRKSNQEKELEDRKF